MASHIEYRVRPVTRYIVTRYEQDQQSDHCGSCGPVGEFANEQQAQDVANALSRRDSHTSKAVLDGRDIAEAVIDAYRVAGIR